MYRRLSLWLCVFAASTFLCEAQSDAWLQARSAHFVVISNAPEKDVRRVSRQFERMEAVLVRVFPEANLDTAAPITVLAVQDKQTLETLEPAAYLGKGELHIAGLFLRSPEKTFALILMNAPGLHPYSPIYHEYTHFVLSRTGKWMPLWLSEGWAQYYQTTEIFDDKVHFGKLDPGVMEVLHINSLLPLPKLLGVDQHSPYYHEEDKGSIFYSESWLLTHYLITKDNLDGTHRLLDYLDLLQQKADPVAAATQAFGDLDELFKKLHTYIVNGDYGSQDISGSTDVDDSSTEVRALSPTESANERADFLAHVQRDNDARSLLDAVMVQDQDNVRAREIRAYIAVRQGNYDEGRRWATQAIKLDPDSFFAHYLVGLAGIKKPPADAASRARINESLQTAIKINPSFAPAFEAAGIALAMFGKNSDEEAHKLIQRAIEMDPGTINFRVDDANVLLQMNRTNDAIDTLNLALKMAHSPEETAAVENILQSARQFQTARSKLEQKNATQLQQAPTANSTTVIGRAPARPIHTVQPEYTAEARAAKREGVCELVMTVGIDGKPTNVVITRKLGMGLDERAVSAAQQWRFEPATLNGKPSLSRYSLKLTFKLFGDDRKIYDLSAKARAGDPAAEFELAQAFFAGKGVAKDDTQGLALLERAARGGIPQAQFQMAERLYGDGMDASNFIDAYVWYMLAMRGGIEQTEMKTNELEQKMSPEELAEAHKRLDKFSVAPAQ